MVKYLKEKTEEQLIQNEVLINANEFEYNKETNILIATGSVKIEDTINNYIIFTDKVTYYKNNEIIFTEEN